MRTTIDLDDEIHSLARRRAFETRKSIGEVVSDLARRGLEAEAEARPKRILGQFEGRIRVSDDFNDTPDEVLSALNQPLA
jgi:negative regulator of replication initiation